MQMGGLCQNVPTHSSYLEVIFYPSVLFLYFYIVLLTRIKSLLIPTPLGSTSINNECAATMISICSYN